MNDVAGEQLLVGARRVALRYVEEASASRARLENPEDGEALHDFRVALRRLRSWQRALPRALGRRVAKRVRQLTKVANATGVARDAEVLLDGLKRERVSLSARFSPGLDVVERRLERLRDGGYETARKKLERFDRVIGKLESELGRTVDVVADAPKREATLGVAIVDAIEKQRAVLERHLNARATADSEALHDLRIAGKRLRYLAEPFRDHLASARMVVLTLKQLQSTLGALHDLDVFANWIVAEGARVASERATRRFSQILLGDRERKLDADLEVDTYPVLMALAKRLAGRRARHERALRSERWATLGDRLDTFSRHLTTRKMRVVRRAPVKEAPMPAASLVPTNLVSESLPRVIFSA